MDAEAEEGLTVADYVSGEEKCEARKDVDADTVRGYMTFRCGLPIGHPGSHQVERVAGGPLIWKQSAEHTLQTGGPGMQPCGNVGPFDGITCKRTVGHSGHHKHTAAGTTSVWSDVTEESVARQLASLQRKVRAQANQIIKLEELRRAAVAKQPEHRELADQLRSQVQLTMRENALRRQAETDRDSERKRGDRFQEELRKVMNDLRTVHVDQVRHNNDRFYRLAALLTDDTAGETWDTLLQRVADLKAELEVERVRANTRKAELDKLNAHLTDPFGPRMFLGPSAEYGTTPLAARVAELAKDLDGVSRVTHVLNERLTKLENTTETKLSDQLADAQAAAGWREQCGNRVSISHKLDSAPTLHICGRAAGHTGQHNSDPQSGEGRQW